MYLAPTADQSQIAEATRDVLAAEASFERWFIPSPDASADDRRLSSLAADMGWTGFGAPEDIGGSGATPSDEMLVFRELGARLAPVGIAAAAIAARVARLAGKVELAQRLVTGEARAGLAIGTNAAILAGAPAEIALHVDGTALTLFDAAQTSVDGVALDWITPTGLLDSPGIVAAVNDPALAREFMLLVAAQAQGVAETALAQANAYAKEREQFGRAIGSFQAIRHRVADMEIRARRAEMQLRFATVRNGESGGDAAFQCLVAAQLALTAARENGEANIFIHGAMGVTTENIGHLLLKRALLWRLILGPETAMLDAIAACGAPAL